MFQLTLQSKIRRRKDAANSKFSFGPQIGLSSDEDALFVPMKHRIDIQYFVYHEPAMRWRQRDTPGAVYKDTARLNLLSKTSFPVANWLQRRHIRALKRKGRPLSYSRYAMKVGTIEWSRTHLEQLTWVGRYQFKVSNARSRLSALLPC